MKSLFCEYHKCLFISNISFFLAKKKNKIFFQMKKLVNIGNNICFIDKI